MKTEPKTKFAKDIVPKAISLLLALTDSLPVLILYIFTVLWYTVLNRAETFEILQTELFWSFRKFLAGTPHLGIEIAGNVIMFIPFGFLLSDLLYKWTQARTSSQSIYPMASPVSSLSTRRSSDRRDSHSVASSAFSPSDYPMRKTSGKLGKWLLIPLLALSFSLLIESLQLSLVRGLAEVDDLFTNTLGAVFGICTYKVLQKLSKKRTFKAMPAIIRAAFVFICLIVLIFSRKFYHLEENNLTRSFCFQVDEAAIQGNELTLRGFAFGYNHHQITPILILRQTKTMDQKDMDVSLRQAKNENQIVLNVNYGSARPDVNKYFLCDYDYTNVGFTATGIVNPGTEYEIMIGWPLAKLVSTGVYILGEDVHRVAYEENLAGTGRFKMPDLSTGFIKNGTLLLYRPDVHTWIFQYDGSLYWVVGEGFHFEDDGTTKIQYQLWTTQLQNLPSDRIKKNYIWDNIGGYFEKYELSGDFGKYRVMCSKLPTEYSITSILTGYYKDGEWVWVNSFRPAYVF